MPTFKLTLTVEQDGVPLDPIVRRIECDEAQSFAFEKIGTGDAVYVAGPVTELTELQALIVQTDQTLSIRLNNQTTGSIKLNPGGLLLLFDCDIDTGTLFSLNNAAAASVVALVRGLAGGT